MAQPDYLIWVSGFCLVENINMQSVGAINNASILLGGSHNTFRDSTMNNSGNTSIAIEISGTRTVVDGIHLSGQVGEGVRITGHENTVSNCFMDNVRVEGIGVNSGDRHRLSGNYIKQVAGGVPAYGIDLAGTGSVVADNTIVTFTGGDGMRIAGTGDHAVTGNSISGSGNVGIEVGSDGNTIGANNVNGVITHGVHLAASDKNVVVGNQISDNGGDGIFVDESADNLLVGNYLSFMDDNGIRLDANISAYAGNSVEGNYFDATGLDGVTIVGNMDDTFINGNYFNTVGGDAIDIGSSADSTLIGINYFTGTVGSDITDVGTGTIDQGVEELNITQTGNLTAGSGVIEFPVEGAWSIIDIQFRVATAPSGGPLWIDVHKNGTTFFTTQANRPTAASTVKVSNQAVPDVTSVADADYLTFDVDNDSSSPNGAADLLIKIRWRKA